MQPENLEGFVVDGNLECKICSFLGLTRSSCKKLPFTGPAIPVQRSNQLSYGHNYVYMYIFMHELY